MKNNLLSLNNIYFETKNELFNFFKYSSREKQEILLKGIFSENEDFLSNIFPNDRDSSSFDISFLFLEYLPIGIIDDLQEIIENIFKEAEDSIEKKESINIIDNIRVFVFIKKKGLSIHFISSRILNSKLPIKTRIELSLLLVYLDPNGETFDWYRKDILNRYPYLIPAKMKFYVNDSYKILKEFLSVKKPPENVIVNYIIRSPLIDVLKNLLIKEKKYESFVYELEPIINTHWSKRYVYEILENQLFIDNGVLENIEKHKKRFQIPEQAYKEIETKYYDLKNNVIKIIDFFKLYNLDKGKNIYSLFDYHINLIYEKEDVYYNNEFENKAISFFIEYLKPDFLTYLDKNNIQYNTHNTASTLVFPNKKQLKIIPDPVRYLDSLSNDFNRDKKNVLEFV